MAVKYYRAAEDLDKGDYVLADGSLLRKAPDKKFALGALQEDVKEGKKVAAKKIFSGWEEEPVSVVSVPETAPEVKGSITIKTTTPDTPEDDLTELWSEEYTSESSDKSDDDLPSTTASGTATGTKAEESRRTYWWDLKKKGWSETLLGD